MIYNISKVRFRTDTVWDQLMRYRRDRDKTSIKRRKNVRKKSNLARLSYSPVL